MPTYAPPCSSDGHAGLRRDASGVSEVVGYILMFGILSIITVLAMITFAEAQESTHERVIALRADSAAQRVALVVVDAALFGEQYKQTATFSHTVELDQTIDGREYEVHLWQDSESVPGECDSTNSADRVLVTVPSISYCAEAPLFAAAAPADVDFCPTIVPGGRVAVVFGHIDPDDSMSQVCVHLEAGA